MFNFQKFSHNCRYGAYKITVKDKAGRDVYSQISQSAGVFNITDLAPFTLYSVSVEVVDDRNLSSTAVKNILTAETCKY